MPWSISRSEECPASRPWAVTKDGTGEVEGCHETEEAAMRQRRALYASEAEKSMDSYSFVTPQDDRYAVKAKDNGDGTATLTGMGIVFDEPGTKAHRDWDGQYFTKSTDFGPHAASGQLVVPSRINHGRPISRKGEQPTEEARRIASKDLGAATLTRTEKGWLFNLIADVRKDYIADTVEAARQGLLGLSGIGLFPEVENDGHISKFYISEMGPTPTPSEPRIKVTAAKSWQPESLYKSCGCKKGKSCGCNANRDEENHFPEVGQIMEPTAEALSVFLETPFPDFGSEAAVAQEAKRLGLTDPSGYAEAKRMQWEAAQRRAQREWKQSLIQDLNSLSFAH